MQFSMSLEAKPADPVTRLPLMNGSKAPLLALTLIIDFALPLIEQCYPFIGCQGDGLRQQIGILCVFKILDHTVTK